MLLWIRARRHKWLGHIVRMELDSRGEERLIKTVLRTIHSNRQTGDLLMDVAPNTTWQQLQKKADDRDA